MQHSSFYSKIIFGVIAFGIGVSLLIAKPWILEYVTDSVLTIKPNSPIKNLWLRPPDLVPTEVYFFNWTNPQDFYKLSVKPKFEQHGPYSYMQRVEKRNVVWNDNDTVTYNQMLSWYFDKEHTNGSLSDSITTLDAMAASLGHYVRNWNYFMKTGVSMFLSTNSYKVHFTKTVDQFLNGFEDQILDMSNLFPYIATDIPRFEKFGLISFRNASETFDGVFNIANGVNGNFDLLNWNYHNVTPYFNADCAKIRGSAGELYSRKMATKDYIEVFLPDVCRPMRLDFEEEVVVHGISGYKYVLGRSALDNGSLVPGNDCYCSGDCIPSGLINISSCRYGLPYYASLPHYYAADPVYLNAVEGLHPEKEKHEAYIVLEPKTRILLKAAARFQMNILIHPIESISLYEDVRKLYFPMAWGQQIAVLPYPQRLFLKIYLASSDVMIVISVLLIFLGLYLILLVKFKSQLTALYKKFIKPKPTEQETMKPEKEPLQHETKRNSVEIVVAKKEYS